MTENAKEFSCLICGGRDYSVYSRNQRDLWCNVPITVDYARCKECGLVQQNPAPEDVSPFYEGYPVHKERSGLYSRIRTMLNKDVLYRQPGGNTAAHYGCDYGCGDGNFLSVITGQANVKCCGYEIFVKQAQQVAEQYGVTVYTKIDEVAEKARECGGFHFISMHHVLEHVQNPLEVIGELSGMLRSGGVIHACTPSLTCLESRIFGEKWHGIDAPRHIFYPEKEHYRRLAEKCGLRLRHARRARLPMTLAASLSIALTGRLRGPLFNLFMPASWALSAILPGSLIVAQMEKP